MWVAGRDRLSWDDGKATSMSTDAVHIMPRSPLCLKSTILHIVGTEYTYSLHTKIQVILKILGQINKKVK
jgi:hypothetical protein